VNGPAKQLVAKFDWAALRENDGSGRDPKGRLVSAAHRQAVWDR